MKRVNVALLGAGAMGAIMAQSVYPRLLDRIKIVAVVDTHSDRAAPLAAVHGAAYFATLAEALAAVRVDAVDIRLPHSAHADAALQVLAAGLHVLVEKPLATSLSECIQLADAADAAGRVAAVSENYPHLKAVRAAKSAIDDGSVGEVLGIRTTRAYTLDGVWARAKWRSGGGETAGVLWDQGTHHASLIRTLAGPIKSVSAKTSKSLKTTGAEFVTVTVDCESGLVGESLYCWGTPAVDCDVEGTVLGSSGRLDISVDYHGDRGVARRGFGSEFQEISARESYYDSHKLILEDWIHAIRTGSRPLVDIASATSDVRFVLAASRSLKGGGNMVGLREIV